MIEIFSDGSCRNNGKKGALAGWSYVCLCPFACGSGLVPIKKQSVNTAELWAIHEAIKRFGSMGGVIFTDSDYCVGVLSKTWQINENREIVDMIKKMEHFTRYSIRWVRGHSGVYGNELANKIATMETANARGTDFENHELPFEKKKVYEFVGYKSKRTYV